MDWSDLSGLDIQLDKMSLARLKAKSVVIHVQNYEQDKDDNPHIGV